MAASSTTDLPILIKFSTVMHLRPPQLIGC